MRKGVDYVCNVGNVLTVPKVLTLLKVPHVSVNGYVFRNLTSGMVRDSDKEGVVNRSCGWYP